MLFSHAGLSEVDQTRLSKLDGVMQFYVDTDRIAGSVVLVKHEGRDVYHKAFGRADREAGIDMQKDTIFRIASMSKAVISTAILQLQEDGKLTIMDPVGEYLPEFQETTVAVENEEGGYEVVPATRPVTIRDLLTHTAGISYGHGPAADQWQEAGIQGWYLAHHDEPVRETVRRMASLPFDAHPGERFVYGYNTDILGAVVEVVSGEQLDEYLDNHILGPLDMKDTHFYLPKEKRDRLAATYKSVPEDGSIERSPDTGTMWGQGEYVDGPRKSFSGGAGLLSTTRDYGRFLQAFLNGGTLGRTRILSRKTVELMTSNHIGGIDFIMGSGFGLGFRVVLDVGSTGVPGSVGEFGWAGAYHTMYWVDPVEDLAVVFMTQLLPAAKEDDMLRLRAIVYQSLE